MVFRDFAQGAFRMRGIGDGQTISLVMIPEIVEVMAKELGKISKEGSASAAHEAPEGSPRRKLKDVASWLVVNAMRSEHVQLNMLAQQDLNGMARLNACNQLLLEHTSFTLSDGKGYLQRLLADDTLVSATGVGSLPKYVNDPCFQDMRRYTLLLFATPEALVAKQGPGEALKRTNMLQKGHAIVWVPSTACGHKQFQQTLAGVPGWLAIPPGQRVRIRRLREYFALSARAGQQSLVILDTDFSVINSSAQTLVDIARQLSEANAIEEKNAETEARLQAQADEAEVAIQAQKASMEPHWQRLQHLASRLQRLDPRDLSELGRYIEEPTVAVEANAALVAAGKGVAEAKLALQKISELDLAFVAEVREDDASEPLKAAVEAVCALMGRQPSFSSAQVRLMRPTAAALVARLVIIDPARIPQNTESKVGAYLARPPPEGGERVACALRAFLQSNVNYARAVQARDAALQGATHTPSMTATVQLLCELNGLSMARSVSSTGNFRLALQMAATFPEEACEDIKGASHDILALEERTFKLKNDSERLIEKAAYESGKLHEKLQKLSTVCTELEALTVEHLNETLASFSGRGKKAKVVKVLLYLLAPSTVKAERDVGVALSKTFNVASGGGEQLLEALKKAVTKLTNNGLNEDEDEAFACVQCPSSNEKERFSQRDSPARLDCCHC